MKADRLRFSRSTLLHTLIRSFPEVDPERTAVTGISWGVTVVDERDAMVSAAVEFSP